MALNTFLLKDVSAPIVGDQYQPKKINKTFQLYGKTESGSGAVSCDVEVSNDGVNWLLAGTITLTLSTTLSSDGFEIKAPWTFIRGEITSISGTGAIASLVMGV